MAVLILLAAVVVIALGVLLHGLCFAWELYRYTAVGGRFLGAYGVPQIVRVLASKNIPALALWTTLIALGTSLTVAGVSQFLELLSPLHVNCGKLARFIIWKPSLIWLIAALVQAAGLVDTFRTAFWLALLPALCLTNRSFGFAFTSLPELGTLITAWPRLSRVWDVLHRSLVLIVLSTVLSAMLLYLMKFLNEEDLFPFINLGAVFLAGSSSGGNIPSDLTMAGLIELALTLTLTVFLICVAVAVAGHFFQVLRVFYCSCARAVKVFCFGPFSLLLCGLGIWYFVRIEPFQAAVALAVIPTATMCGPVFKQISDFVPGHRKECGMFIKN